MKIIPVDCVAKTSKEAKAFWLANGVTIEDLNSKLAYKFLAGLKDTDTGKEIVAAVQDFATKVSGILDAKLKEGRIKTIELEAVSILEGKVMDLTFGKTIRADAVRLLANLPALPVEPKNVVSEDSEEDTVDAVEL